MENLNPRQKEAVEKADGIVLIAAGPGTGKTRTLTTRIAYLIAVKGIEPGRILALTFTRNAAKEMQERVEKLLKPAAAPSSLWGKEKKETPWIETFHAACLKILKEENYPFGPGQEWSLVTEEEKAALLQGSLGKRKLKDFLEALRKTKQALQPLQEPLAQQYQERLLALGRLDYDDLLFYVHELFEKKPEVLARWRTRFHHILVDEFQDTSFAQYELLKKLRPQNLCVIGDPDQAIYSFASDGFAPFEAFKKDFPTHSVIALDENYRSQALILNAAQQIIRHNPAGIIRKISAKLEAGPPLEIACYATERQEAEMIVKKIERLLGGSSGFAIESCWADKEQETYSYGLSDIAILYRFHAQARLIEEALDRAGLPFQTWGKKEGWEDLEDFVQNEQALKGDKITLMTLHRSKGLEFPVVFIAGCEKDVLAETQEERRLFYVGLTRAKRRLFLSWAKKRMLYGKTLTGGPASFLADIEDELKRLEELQSPRRKTARTNPTPMLF